MSLTIQLTPEEEHRLAEAAARCGQAPEESARAALAERLAADEPAEPFYAGLPRRDPVEMVAAAREQGRAALDFDALLGARFWPEDESADDFIRAVRAWRREGSAT